MVMNITSFNGLVLASRPVMQSISYLPRRVERHFKVERAVARSEDYH